MFKWNSYTNVEMLIVVVLSTLGGNIIAELREEKVVPTPVEQTTSSSQIRVMEKVDIEYKSVHETLVVACDKERGNLIYMTYNAISVTKQTC